VRTYYVVMLKGSPIEVFGSQAAAELCARERSTVAGTAHVVPMTPLQTEFEFEETTKPDTCACEGREMHAAHE
jgi:hypothetical protein